MDLPFELVLSILRFAVIVSSPDRPINVTAVSSLHNHRHFNFNSRAPPGGGSAQVLPFYTGYPPILRTCHLLRHEGINTVFAANVFRCGSNPREPLSLISWLESLQKEHFDAVGPISLTVRPCATTKVDRGILIFFGTTI